MNSEFPYKVVQRRPQVVYEVPKDETDAVGHSSLDAEAKEIASLSIRIRLTRRGVGLGSQELFDLVVEFD